MHFTKVFLALALVAAPVFANPTAVVKDDVFTSSTRASTSSTCKPTENSSPTKPFKARTAGFEDGKSSYPHLFGNKEKIAWGLYNCDSGKRTLNEYPVFWKGAKQKEWEKDTKVKDQDKTPIRVVYANADGSIYYCGIMIHSKVDKDYTGSDDFVKCD
ncbi:hypothetical protein SERLA73DRAFT_169536 [Serpula lacrymans var. lacrymans S7.3]|uniref:Uncharacterized protein n=2 Tax=Serpula lacrymans var. lacrymans TaxID=341189 RepID=F8Q3K2_SERL3|nr:uncharacterized protein SERLADRAFT_450457 [Serpula lacrymans var. lacrymans S7.9]EGN97087.1 hypothetical protein SERLA73DRAFT_169536 [Serpula lacrymans var. lacrymans S7.3]EGO22693.1 hypothetical protein SERLADRAFT_450457 [Serpula lacrymans var. lacrymans S7.9]